MSNMVSTRTGFGGGLIELAARHIDTIVTSADTYRSFSLGSFVERYPDRYFEFGIAEQGMLTASAAMASEGYRVFSVGYSPFLSMRALEQIRTFAAYPNLNVKVVAGLGGLSGDTDGVTHQGTEDIGIMRTIPNLALLCPADAVAAKAAVQMAYDYEGPVYIRLGRGATPIIYEENQKFIFGRSIKKVDMGDDIVIVTCGSCVGESEKAAKALAEQGLKVTVLDMFTIKPLDTETLIEVCQNAKAVFTVEDGSIYGGLGGAVSEAFMDAHISPKVFKRLGLTTFGTAGEYPQLLSFFGIDSEGIEKTILQEREKI